MKRESDCIKELKAIAPGANFLEQLRNIYHQLQPKTGDELALSKLAIKRALKLPGEDRQTAFKEIASGSRCWGLGESATRILALNNAISSASSMRVCLVNQTIRNQLSGYDVATILNKKHIGRQFMNMIGVKVPQTYTNRIRLEDLEVTKRCVVKPRSGSNSSGVYLILSENRIFSVRGSRYLTSIDDLKQAMALDIENGNVREDSWFLEELVLEDTAEVIPGRDVKFFCFYGEVPLALEIVRTPEKRYCWWSAPGKEAETGKYEDARFLGSGYSEAELKNVKRISKEIPLPFIRIDFIRSEKGLTFGELTPRPGNFEDFDINTDIELGRHFLTAEGKLMKDMLAGRVFESYMKLLRKV